MASLSSGIRDFVVQSLVEMNAGVDVSELDEDATLGPAGADLDSLVLAELVVRVEEQYGVKFSADENERMPALTIREFCDLVAAYEHTA
jgi:acyl carrier protein